MARVVCLIAQIGVDPTGAAAAWRVIVAILIVALVVAFIGVGTLAGVGV
ncbi:MAG: hypothetical protein ACE37H_16240 [Phycisphaeraceae bacterium]